MSALESQLPGEMFCRVSRSAILNLCRVQELQSGSSGDHLAIMADSRRVASTEAFLRGRRGSSICETRFVLASVMTVAVMLMTPLHVKAGSDDAALLDTLKQMASRGQNAQTAAQVSQFVDQNQDVIKAVLHGYEAYIKQVQSLTDDSVSVSGTATARQQTALAPLSQPIASGTSATTPGLSYENAAAAQAPLLSQEIQAQPGELQPSGSVQGTHVQPSGPLQTSHLAGYPALPDVDPVSSVTHLDSAQQDYAAKVRNENEARKAYLMSHPEGYTY